MVHRHGAVIIKGNAVIARGFNKAVNGMFSVHAEEAAIFAAGRRPLKGCVMVVVRASSSGKLMSMPCERCQTRILNAGIIRVFFSS